MSKKDITVKIETILSQILSRKYDAEIKIKFEDDEREQRRNNNRACGVDSYARERNHKS